MLLLVLLARQATAETVAVWDLTGIKKGAEGSIEARRASWDTLQAASALEGIVNRSRVRLYLRFVGDDGKLDGFWLNRLRATWLKNAEVMSIRSLDDAIWRFRYSLHGVVLWDERVPATSNVASTIAGVEDLLPVRYDPSPGSLFRHLVVDPDGPKLTVRRRLVKESGESLFTGSGSIPDVGLPSTGSSKCDAYVWAIEKYLRPGKCMGGWLGYYPDATWLKTPHGIPLERTLLTNHDFFIAKKGFVFDLSPWDDEQPDDALGQKPGTDFDTLRRILLAEYRLNRGKFAHVGGFTPWDQKYTDFTGRKHGGVETEWRYAEILTCFNAYMDADAPGLHAMANASAFMHEPLKAAYRRTNLPSVQSLEKRGFVRPDGSVLPKAYASVYVGDYDSAAWLYTMMPQLWNDPARGAIPLGWAFNPALEERFATGLVYARDTATANDFFVSGDSGAGYLNPGYLTEPRRWSGLPSGLAEWEKLNRRLFDRWGLGIVGFVIDGNAPPMTEETKAAYARFAPWGVVAQKVPELSLVGSTPFLRMGSDLPHDDLVEAARIVAREIPANGPSFHIFRTILWSPKEHVALFKQVKEIRPDIEFVDPYTLFSLARLSRR